MRAGGLVAYPTETLWGLGADARSEPALERLRAWKRRDDGQPISILVDRAEALPGLGISVGPVARTLAAAFWPGPLTLVLPSRGGFARGVASASGAVGVRCSSHPLARALAERLAQDGVGPITATSLNRSGEPPARTRAEACALCEGPDAPWLVDAPETPEAAHEPMQEPVHGPSGLASTVVDATGSEARLLRAGAIPKGALRAALARANLRLEERSE